LDISAVFDTVIHSKLLLRLNTDFGIEGGALTWLESYLAYRTQVVCSGCSTSSPVVLAARVPQGSVLGPFLFIAYVSPLARVITSHNVRHHSYAEDNYAYCPVSYNSKVPAAVPHRLKSAVLAVQDWNSENCMLVNADKSSAILVYHHRKFVTANTCSVAGTTVPIKNTLTTL